MSESLWGKQGETLSHKNACREFGLAEAEVLEAMKAGKLQYRQGSAHGNPYFRLLRSEVISLAHELHGPKWLMEQQVQYKLRKIDTEMNSLKRRLASLAKQRDALLEG